MNANQIFGHFRRFLTKPDNRPTKEQSKPENETKKKKPKQNRTANALPYNLVNRRCLKTIRNQEEHPTKRKSAFMLLVMANTGLRFSDTILLKYRDITNVTYQYKTQKTGSNNVIEFNNKVQEAYQELIKNEQLKIGFQTKYIFVTQGYKLIKNQQINNLIKELFADYSSRGYNVSSYSMRKTFSTQLIDCAPNKMIGFVNLQEAFGHKDAKSTYNYLDKRSFFPKTISRKNLFSLKKYHSNKT